MTGILPTENVIPSLTGEALSRAGHDLVTPFAVALGDGQSLLIDKVLRLVPGRRIVGQATTADGATVLAKLFLGRSGARYAARERHGLQALKRSGVPAPAFLSEHEIDGGQLVTLEFLPGAISLMDAWSGSPTPACLRELLASLGQMHKYGVVQNDIHLDNFLLSEEKLYLIDGGAIEQKSSEPLDETPAFRNLATFFAQLYPRFDAMMPDVIDAYLAARDWQVSEHTVEQLREEIARERQRRKRVYISKAFRECSRYVCRTSMRRFVVCDRAGLDSDMEALLADPDSFISQGELLKDGNTATVARVNLARGPVVVKRYNIKDRGHGLRRAVTRSRASRSWTNAHHMELLGIPALKPLALIEKRLGPFRGTTYLITDYIDGPDALSSLASPSDDAPGMDGITTILERLARARITHGDLKATNFLMSDVGPVIIDLDAMREHRSRDRFSRAFSRDLRRFLANWDDKPRLAEAFRSRLQPLTTDLDIPAALVP